MSISASNFSSLVWFCELGSNAMNLAGWLWLVGWITLICWSCVVLWIGSKHYIRFEIRCSGPKQL